MVTRLRPPKVTSINHSHITVRYVAGMNSVGSTRCHASRQYDSKSSLSNFAATAHSVGVGSALNFASSDSVNNSCDFIGFTSSLWTASDCFGAPSVQFDSSITAETLPFAANRTRRRAITVAHVPLVRNSGQGSFIWPNPRT